MIVIDTHAILEAAGKRAAQLRELAEALNGFDGVVANLKQDRLDLEHIATAIKALDHEGRRVIGESLCTHIEEVNREIRNCLLRMDSRMEQAQRLIKNRSTKP